MSFRFSLVNILVIAEVASSPPTDVLPKQRPSITKSRRITTPARIDHLSPGRKLSATPRALMPGLLVWRDKARHFGPFQVFNLGLAPEAVAKIWAFAAGDTVPEAILEAAGRERVRSAGFEAVGGVDRLTLAYYDRRAKRYEQHDFRGFMEVTSMLGNITQKDGKPFVHAHGNFGTRDLRVVGGHIISARVFPTLEMIVRRTSDTAVRRFDERLGLNLISRTR